MKKINNIIIIIISIISYVIALYNLKNKLYVKFLSAIFIIPTMLLPKILNKFKIKITDKLEFICLIFIILAYFLGTILNLYNYLENYDTIIHFISGIFEAYFGFYILNLLITYKCEKIVYNVLFILGFVSFVSVGWEIFEFISSIVFKIDPQHALTTGVTDTMKDLIVAQIGAIIVCIIYIRNKNIMNKVV